MGSDGGGALYEKPFESNWEQGGVQEGHDQRGILPLGKSWTKAGTAFHGEGREKVDAPRRKERLYRREKLLGIT